MKNVRTLLLFTAAVLTAVLAACSGGSSVKDPFTPSRVVVFGDSLSVRTASARYTVNGSGGIDNWADQIASSYGVTSITSSATANALVTGVASQVSAFGGAYLATDLVVVSAGFRDLINLGQGTASTATATALGTSYADAVRSMVSSGAKHVIVTNVYDFSTSYAAAGGTSSATVMKSLIRAFNDGLKTGLGNASNPVSGAVAALIDSEAYFNLLLASPATYGFTDATTLACTSLGASVGVGTVDSSLCTTATASTSYNSYVYADAIYPTPAAHRGVGTNAFSIAKARW